METTLTNPRLAIPQTSTVTWSDGRPTGQVLNGEESVQIETPDPALPPLVFTATLNSEN